jgi:hypothetical protein
MQERKRFIAEFARRLREARPDERVYMRVGDVFKDADIYSLDEWRAARWAAVFGDVGVPGDCDHRLRLIATSRSE